jgi:hypothetical protein
MDSCHTGRVGRYWEVGALGFEQHGIRVRAVQEATRQQQTENQRLLNEYSTKIKIQLTESKSIYNQAAQYLERGILESYVINPPRDGTAKNALIFAIMTDPAAWGFNTPNCWRGMLPAQFTTEFQIESDEFLSMHRRTFGASGYCPS